MERATASQETGHDRAAASTTFYQAQLTVGPSDDRYEKEADQMADMVMRMPEPAAVQRKCAHCEEEERLQQKPEISYIQAKSNVAGSLASPATTEAITGQRGKGMSMDGSTKSFMETRFGGDFSAVRIHTGSEAVQLSRDLGAQAFTVGSDVFFNQGKYQPGTDSGKHLLAHELTHTIQQGGAESIQKEDDMGSSIRTETVTSFSQPQVLNGRSDSYSGTVSRNEYANAADQNANRAFHSADVNVRFDSSTCTITIPHTVQFVNHDAAHVTTCGGDDPDPVRPVSETSFRESADEYLRANNTGLNDWFRLRVTNVPNTPCDGQNIPIRVVVTEVESNADTTVIITGNSGRSYVSGDAGRNTTVLCNSPSYSVLMHEAGHMTLGTGDEYSERSRVGAGGAARERLTDSSLMAQVGPARLQQLHERHFQFVVDFMQRVYPGATLSLIFGDRSRTIPSLTIGASAGATVGDVSAFYIGLGADMGIPMDVLRRTELRIGPRLQLLVGGDYTQNVMALLMGVRVGFQGNFHTTMFNHDVPLGVGLNIEGGVGTNFFDRSILPDVFPYTRIGGTFGYEGPNMSFGLDAGIGALGGREGEHYQFFQLGLQLVGHL